MEETISLQEIFGIIKKRVALIITSMFICLGISAVVTFVLITPKYASSTQLVVNLPKSEGINANVNDVNFNLQMINTYKDFIKTSTGLSEQSYEILSKSGQFKGSASDISKMLTVGQEQNSQMFSIVATSSSAYEAQAVANTVAKVFQEQAKEVLEIDKISIIAEAPLNLKQVSPNNKLNILIGAVLGLMIGVGIAFLVEILDKTVKDDKFIKETVGFSILGTVPEMTAKELSARMVKTNKAPVPNGSGLTNGNGVTLSRRERNRV